MSAATDSRITGSGGRRPLLEVRDLTMRYTTRAGEVSAVDRVSFSVERGQALGLVGESGCGKSSIAITLLKLLPENASILEGEILIDGVDIAPMSEEEMLDYRWARVSMVFQAAMNSLDPVYRVGDQISKRLNITWSPPVKIRWNGCVSYTTLLAWTTASSRAIRTSTAAG